MRAWVTPANSQRTSIVRPHKPKLIALDQDTELLKCIATVARAHFEVIQTTDPRWAMAWLAQYPDVAAFIVEEELPSASGLRLLRDAKNMRPDVLRVLSSRDIDHPLIVGGLTRGIVDRLIEKPMSRESLLAAISPEYVSDHAYPHLLIA